MSKMISSVAMGLIAMILLALWLAGPVSCRAKGVITLDGYPHAVAICGQASKMDEATVVLNEGVVLHEEGYFLVVNEGHLNDNKLQNLKVLAVIECK